MLFFWYNDNRVCVKFYTADYRYNISAHKDDKGKHNYLGCTASCRKPRVGEVWTRGSDLTDGKYNRETFTKILQDIVSYEIKNL